MSALKFVVPAMFGFALFSLIPVGLHAKPEYSKVEKKGCVTCHVSAKSKDLNDTGKYYKEHKKLPPAK